MLGKTLESSLDSKVIKPTNPKEINLEYSLEGLMLKLQHFGHLMQRTDSLAKALMLGMTEGKRKRVSQRMRWLDSITDSMDMNLSKFREILEDRGPWCSWGRKESDMTWWLNYNIITMYIWVWICSPIFSKLNSELYLLYLKLTLRFLRGPLEKVTKICSFTFQKERC